MCAGKLPYFAESEELFDTPRLAYRSRGLLQALGLDRTWAAFAGGVALQVLTTNGVGRYWGFALPNSVLDRARRSAHRASHGHRRAQLAVSGPWHKEVLDLPHLTVGACVPEHQVRSWRVTRTGGPFRTRF